ncbi:hypothetical protein KSS87_019746 [Heliosperma pusillum]|nr:hypothetical protein KSS87_019746 [Heliosperma pusillum]
MYGRKGNNMQRRIKTIQIVNWDLVDRLKNQSIDLFEDCNLGFGRSTDFLVDRLN